MHPAMPHRLYLYLVPICFVNELRYDVSYKERVCDFHAMLSKEDPPNKFCIYEHDYASFWNLYEERFEKEKKISFLTLESYIK